MGLQSRSTSFQWFLKFTVQKPLIFVVRYRLVEIIFQLCFIEFKIFIHLSHRAFVLQNLIAFDLNRGLFAASEVVYFWKISFVSASQFFTHIDFENFSRFLSYLLLFPFLETQQVVSWPSEFFVGDSVSNWSLFFVEKTDLDIFV